ncbi:MAG: phage tail sheath family protein [Firmicutes bacterium]|nr:phage tail sheath family protein [Bacillota bacterium]
MALGGGVFTNQNKVLPGAYINFVSAMSSNAAVSDRGVAAMALMMDWGKKGEMFSLTKNEFLEKAPLYFGYNASDDELKGIRDLFLNVKKCYFYRLNGGAKAQNTYAQAKCFGTCGNKIKIVIRNSIYVSGRYDVITYFDGKEVDLQTVSASTGLKANDYVTFKIFTMAVTTGSALSGGTSENSVSDTIHSNFLSALESLSFNTLCCFSEESSVQSLYIQFTQDMRDSYGIKFQTLLYNASAPDYIGIVNLKTAVTDSDADGNELLYWTAGALSACGISESLTNRVYDGEFTPDADMTQEELEAGIAGGEFLFHRVGDEIRVLADINSFTDFDDEMGSDFAYNQVIRIIDTAANDLAYIFNSKYLGKVQNNRSGRISFWNEVVTYNRTLENMGVIEDFNPDEVVVEEGNTRDSIVVANPLKIVSAMAKLYMTIVVA